MTEFLDGLISSGWRVHAVPIVGGWLEVDTPEDLATYELGYEGGVLKVIFDVDAVPISIEIDQPGRGQL